MNLTDTSNVAPAEALDTITPASAVKVIPNEADTSPSRHPSGEVSDFRLPATASAPASTRAPDIILPLSQALSHALAEGNLPVRATSTSTTCTHTCAEPISATISHLPQLSPPTVESCSRPGTPDIVLCNESITEGTMN